MWPFLISHTGCQAIVLNDANNGSLSWKIDTCYIPIEFCVVSLSTLHALR